MNIRRATPRDVPGMLALKNALQITAPSCDHTGKTHRGGFLLGSDATGYAQRISGGDTWVLEHEGTVVGFSITLPDALFRASEVWEHRVNVSWREDPAPLESATLTYFDQLALSPTHGARRYGTDLAITSLLSALESGMEFLVTTTVRHPVRNLAAVPFLERLGGRVVGVLDEVYPSFGPLVSDLWIAERKDCIACLETTTTPGAQRSLARAREALAS